jgi:hypothetical protein
VNAVALVLAGLSSLSLSLAFARTGPFYEPMLAALLGAIWVLILAVRPRMPAHGLFLFLGLAAAGITAARGSTLLGLAAATATLFAWDAITMHRLILDLPPHGRHRIARRYALQALSTAAAAFALAAGGLVIHPTLGFPAALGTALGVLVLLAIAMWQSARMANSAGATASSGSEREKADGA